ncbi:FAD-dependent oxidoreductase [Paraconexibacter antarcticus]|uniref:FAD-dependent oxidoreductase n=1 Tax=Paraconexibacter antarcticus TaxID=2949664 RepID=A0ABY5DSH1_9ACTN|nr:FAD-dependent oxidoreductase [Paraconexibacter antarcticus]UTI64405.1 FAD-dependent oxidoreductase [Paraconexibacter antarcticus]
MDDGQQDRQAATGVTRRRFLRDAGTAGALIAVPGLAAGTARAATTGRRVAVLGGGMAGLAAAHELVERGFRVTVYERNALGGKARSIPVAGTARGGRKDLPGEHGFRFFPGFYHHVPDTMRRIPFGHNAHGVGDNLVNATGGKFLRAGDRADAGPFGIFPDPTTIGTPDGLRRQLTESLKGEGLPPQELSYFVERLMVFATSSDERRFGQWEHTSWWDFIGAESRSQEYKTVAAAGMTRSVVAAKETVASTRTIGNMAEAFVFTAANLGNDGALDRVRNLPTNEAWIDPWVVYLRSRGVRFVVGRSITGLDVKGGRIVSARSRDARGRRHRIDADWFVSAMPAERARRVWDAPVLAADPALKGMDDLFVDWMAGIQFFLDRKADLVHGHISFIDAPWALTGLTQGQFWGTRAFARDYGDGSAVDCLSVDISNWDAKGVLFGKTAKECTPDEIAKEVWAQIMRHGTAAKVLSGVNVRRWFLDPGIVFDRRTGRNRNATPLLVNTVGTWEKRPQARTAIPNLFLAGDYVQTNIDLATMEGANESARAAVTALLDAAGSSAAPPQMYKLYRSPAMEPAKAIDAQLYRAGLPNALDVPVA